MKKDNSIIVRLCGGLGNQLFQYAFGQSRAMAMNTKLFLDVNVSLRGKKADFLLNVFRIDAQLLKGPERIIYNILFYGNRKLKIKNGLTFESEIFQIDNLDNKQCGYFFGYWQNVGYFNDIRKKLQQELEYNGTLPEKIYELIRKLEAENSVALHVRRGDYLQAGYNAIYVTQNMDYYNNAIEYIESVVNNPKYYIFSNDIEWCKANLKSDKNISFVSDIITKNSVEDFELMKHCRYFIISNSTFSWWPAWLSDYDNKIVMSPSRWFHDEGMNQKALKALIHNNQNGEWILS